MKLRYSATSPYVRKVMVTAIEMGVADTIELLSTNVWAQETDIHAHNPLGKVPALVLEDGMVLFDSPVICEYLAAQSDDTSIFPAPGPARWTALRHQALGDGIMDAALLRRMESGRPPGEKSDAWIGRQKITIERALDELEQEADSLGEGLTIGHIAIGCALGYLDLRFAEDNWRAERPALADWFDTFSARRSMMDTTATDPA